MDLAGPARLFLPDRRLYADPRYARWLADQGWLYLMVAAGLIVVINPLFHPLLGLLPDAPPDSLVTRLLESAVAGVTVLAAALVPALRARSAQLLVLPVGGLLVSTAALVVDSGNHPFYVAASLISVFGAQLGFVRVREMAISLGGSLMFQAVYAYWRGHLSTADDVVALLVLSNGAFISLVMGTLRVRIQERQVATQLELADMNEALAKAEVAERALREAAEAANKAKSAFLANMSHELRTPLNAIIGYSELVAEIAGDEGFTVIDKDAKRITHAGTHLLALINEVLDLSKIESGKMEIQPEEFELSVLLDDVRAMAGPLADKRGNGLRVEYAKDLGVVRLDRTRVRQILLNLLSNAAKFTERGEIALVVHADGPDAVVFSVSDTGLGMSTEQLGRLFQAFVQVHEDQHKYGGTGLGLVLCRRFATMMGGDVTVASSPGKGTTFTVTLPRIARVERPSPEVS